jgi:(1->4)-alpha-D-glucan 1-alpha-D-glucosylmutase
MNTLSTHDTKRSADVRARLNVLSELPEAWEEAVHRWAHRNDRHRVGGWPDRNAEYLLYQTLVGAWPLDAERVVAFMAKATREAKVHTSWTDPVADYDEAVQRFAAAVRADDAFVADLEGFLAEHRIVERGRQSSLAQVALLLTSPGVPDLYQGDELWDLSLVDPDNRRPVDHELRRRLLGERRATPGAPPPDVADDELGRAKLHLVHRLLAHRRAHPDLFASSTYEPLDAGDCTVAFARDGIVTVVPCRTGADRAAAADVALPPGRWVDLLTGMRVAGGHQPVAGLLAGFPVSVLAREGS